MEESEMANPRSEHDVEHEMQDTIRTVAEQTGRAGRMMADVGERTFQAHAELFQRNAETLQDVMQSGNELASRLTSRSADQFAKAIGVGGGEAETAVEQSTRNLHAVVRSGAALSKNAQSISKHWFDFMHRQIEQCMDHMDTLMRCRTPQELAAVQSEAMRDHLNGLIETTRRTADLSAQAANEASRHIAEAAESVARRAA
jgi:hypothetical protein